MLDNNPEEIFEEVTETAGLETATTERQLRSTGNLVVSCKFGLRRTDDCKNKNIEPFSQLELKALLSDPIWAKRIVKR
jgi:hypothetical protein